MDEPAVTMAVAAEELALPEGTASVQATLLHRRAPLDLMHQKLWEVGDIVMETASAEVP